MKKYLIPVLIAFAGVSAANAQDSTVVLPSTFQVRLSYESHALQSGRDFDVTQFLMSPSVFYNHRSGVYAGASALYLSESDPAVSQVNFSLGCGRTLTDNWYASMGYSYSLYPEGAESPLPHAISAGLIFTRGKISGSMNYDFLFGAEKAHQLTPGVSAYFEKGLKKSCFSFSPGVSATFGTANVPLSRFSEPLFQRGTGVLWENRDQFLMAKFPRRAAEDRNVFGLMSVQAFLPLQYAVNRLSLELSLNLVQPVELKNEGYEKLEPSIYLGAAVQYRI